MPIRVPEVNQANEFKEIANDFTNPLELIREALRDGLKRIDVGGGKLINVEYSKSGKMYILYYDNDITLYAPHNSSWYSIIYNIRKQYK